MNEIQPGEVRRQLDRILASQGFREAGRLGPFLAFLVESALKGDGAQLKESVIGVEVFQRPAGYDPRTDPIVRVEARRLRSRLDEYYAAHPDPVAISLPKGGYVPHFAIAEAKTEAEPAMPGARRSPWVWIAAVVAVSGGTGLMWFARGRADDPPPKPPVIAVLPFRNLTPDPGNAYFSDGLTVELIDALAKVDRIRVIGWNASRQFRDKPESLAALREQLGATAMVDGAVRSQQGKLRVTAQLTDTSSGQTLWSETYERDVGDLFRIQEQIASAVVAGVRVKLDSAPAAPRATNLEAYNHYLRARYHRNRFSREGFELSNRYAEQAIQADPRFAPAYGLLSHNYVLIGYYAAIPPAQAFARAKELALRAIEIDAASGEARAALGCALSIGENDWPGTRRELDRAVELSPRNADVRAARALCYLLPMGLLEEAEAEMRRSIELDPLAFEANFVAGFILIARGKYDEAVKQYDRVIEIYSDFDDLHCDRAMALALAGRRDEARRAYDEVARVRKQAEWLAGPFELALLGDRAGAMEAAKKLNVEGMDAARAYALLDETDAAFDALERAFRDRETETILLRADPRLRSLRSDARFRKFERMLKLP